MLLANGANVNIKDYEDKTPLIMGILWLNCFFKLLFWKNVFTATGPYKIDLQEQQKNVIELLLKNGANVNSRDKSGRTALHFGIFSIYFQMLF